jgi:Sec-independent protein translocase protein TatA
MLIKANKAIYLNLKKLYMSLFELLVIFVVAFLVVKPEDLPQIAKKVKDFYKFFTKTKTEILSYFDLSHQDSVAVDDDIDQINFYLEKITNLGGEYEGEYSLNKIKDHYQKIVQESIKDEIQLNKEVQQGKSKK